MTNEDILNGNFIDDQLTKKEYIDLIFSLHKSKLTNENVDNVISFINLCKDIDLNLNNNIEWYLLYLLDNTICENFHLNRKILLANTDILKRIEKIVKDQKDENHYPKTVWNSGLTRFKMEEAEEIVKRNLIEKIFDRYDILCNEVKYQMKFIGDHYAMDFDYLIEHLKEMKNLQEQIKEDQLKEYETNKLI